MWLGGKSQPWSILDGFLVFTARSKEETEGGFALFFIVPQCYLPS
jgi:hypothetical protein